MKWRVTLVVGLVLVLLALPALGATPKKQPKTEVSYPVAVASSPAFRDLPLNSAVAVGENASRTIPNPPLNRPAAPGEGAPLSYDEALQFKHGNAPAPSPLISFDGINNISGYAPPDTEGDIGPDHYMQWVNVSLAAWSINRSTWTPTLVLGPVLGNSIWTSLGGQCASDNWGDPIVLWDRFRSRWVISQFALGSGAGGPYKTAIAVSKTADPTGQWWLYCFDYHATTMNDYPKFGVWPDGYYYTCNQFLNASSWGGAGLCVFEADKMINGDPTARQLKIDLGAISLNYGGILPAHFEGTNNPPAGAGYFVEVDDSTWMSPPLAQDSISLWKAHVDWTAPSFTVGVAGLPDLTIPVANFTPLCIGNRNCIPQPGTTQRLDAIADRGMYRCQYRNVGSYETMTFNITVDSGSTVAGVRWFELRKDSGHPDWYLYQEGTYAPADGKHRWMGSAAQDHMGDLCVGYSISDGTATYPSIGYAGRLAGDPVGTLPQAEVVLHAGAASQTGVNRWGDYSTMSIDPVDDCTFWYTTEYTSGGWNWLTRIGAFKFPACSIGPTGTLSGTVTDSGTAAPIVGATVSATNGTITQNVTTGAGGTYTMTLPISPPNYDVTASAFGYAPVTVNGVVINNGATTTQNFALSGATSYLVSGNVTDVNTGWGLYANVTITASGWAGTTIQTNPTTGAYSINLVGGATYNFSVTSMVPGYNVGTATLGPLGGPATQNFQLTVNNCTAPGYSLVGGVAEYFDGTTLPAGWNVTNNGGTCTWVFNNPGGRSNLTGGTGNFAVADSDNCGSATTMNTELRSPVLDFTGVASVPMSFKSDYNNLSSSESADVDVSVNGAAGPWTNVWHQNTDQRGPMTVNLDLSAIAGNQANVMVRFHYVAPGWDWWWEVDDVVIGTPSCVAPAGGLIVGFVKDGGTTLPLAGASVNNATTAFAASSDAAGFYAVYANAGANNLTASMATYQDGTATPTGVAHATVQQDFNLFSSSQYTLSGTVNDSAAGWPLYAQLTFSATGFPTVSTWTDPVTGAYSVTIYGGVVYNVAGTAWAPGYTALATTVGPIGGDTTQNFTMVAAAACTAPGYSAPTLLTENFDGVTAPTLPSGWLMARLAGTNTSTAWTTSAGRVHPSGTSYSSPNVARFNSWTVGSGNVALLYRTSGIDLTGISNPSITFWMYHDTGYTNADTVRVYASPDGLTFYAWTAAIPRYDGSTGWKQHVISFAGYPGAITDVRIGFLGTSAYGNDCYIDDVQLVGACSPPSGGGLVVGNVYDANTSLTLNGATVNDTTSGTTATSAATPADPNVDDGFFCLYGPDGSNAMNATMALYGTDNQTPTVPHYGAVKQDFHLPAGSLSATPTDLTYGLMTGQTGSQTFTLNNVGGASLDFELKEMPGHLAPQKGDLFAAKDAKPEGWAKGQILTANKKKPAASFKSAQGQQVYISVQAQDEAKAKALAAGKTVPPPAPPQRIYLDAQAQNGASAPVPPTSRVTANRPANPWPPSGPIQLYVDDGVPEDSIGLTSGGQFIWFNRFTPTPTDFPFMLDQISVIFNNTVAVGDSMELLIYSDPDGDPNNGATFLYSQNVTVLNNDFSTWNDYTLTTPVSCTGPGDVLVGVVNRSGASGYVDYPAAIDQNASQGRSWIGYYGGPAPDPPTFPAPTLWGTIDSFGLAGNWTVRASGYPADIPWLDENPKTGTLAAGGSQIVTVDYDATGLAPGDYLATIQASQTTPYPPANVHVTLTVWPELVATAAADRTTGTTPVAVNFTGSATGGDGGPYTYDWNFGDGSPHSTAQNPAHIYNVGGTFTVTFTVTDGHGNTATDSHLVMNITQSTVAVVYNLYDDAGRARACFNRLTGAFTWANPAAAPTTTVSGTAVVLNGGTKFVNAAGSPVTFNMTVDPYRKKASGYMLSGGVYTYISDSNINNNPAGCF